MTWEGISQFLAKVQKQRVKTDSFKHPETSRHFQSLTRQAIFDPPDPDHHDKGPPGIKCRRGKHIDGVMLANYTATC